MEDGDRHPITNISNFVDYYPDGRVKLLALNHTAISKCNCTPQYHPTNSGKGIFAGDTTDLAKPSTPVETTSPTLR